MAAAGGRTVAALAIVAGLVSGCGDGGLAGGLRSAGVASSPDEFLVLPTKPLELPTNLAELPPPAPGTANRVDLQPEADAVAALTGRPAPAGSAAATTLVARSGPVDPEIRARLAAEDAAYRRANRGAILERLANRNESDAVIYQDMQLDADAEFERLRARGIRVPAAPPLGP